MRIPGFDFLSAPFFSFIIIFSFFFLSSYLFFFFFFSPPLDDVLKRQWQSLEIRNKTGKQENCTPIFIHRLPLFFFVHCRRFDCRYFFLHLTAYIPERNAPHCNGMFVFLSVCLYVCVSVCLSVCLSFYKSICPDIGLFVCLLITLHLARASSPTRTNS